MTPPVTPPPLTLRARLRVAAAAVRAAVGVDDLVLAAALMLLAIGFALVWLPGAFIVPGLVLLWLVLPSRAPFVTRPPAPKKPADPPRAASGRTA